jgi:hypothetical protein
VVLVQLEPRAGGPYFGDHVTFSSRQPRHRLRGSGPSATRTGLRCTTSGTRAISRTTTTIRECSCSGPTLSWSGGAASCRADCPRARRSRAHGGPAR